MAQANMLDVVSTFMLELPRKQGWCMSVLRGLARSLTDLCLQCIDKPPTPDLSLHTLLTFYPSLLPTTYKLPTVKQTGQGTWTHSDDVIESPGVLDGAAEIQAVEGLSQCTIAVALGGLNYGGVLD